MWKCMAVGVCLAAGILNAAGEGRGRTPLILAVEQGDREAVRQLIASGADLDASPRGIGTALEVAEREGRTEIAAMLRKAGAHTFGRSIGDTICVRPWGGDGYCGTVQAVTWTTFTVRVTRVIGCANGCNTKPECAEGKIVEKLRPGDIIATPGSCVTHTGVRP